MTSVTRLLCALVTTLLPGAIAAAAASPGSEAAPIEDNSFLIEEAYNQEDGIVQHISTLVRDRDGDGWVYAFTQEWPAPTRRHQVGWTLLFVRPGPQEESGPGAGDIGVNYRCMVAGANGGRVAFAPRASVFFPTGSSDHGRGDGGTAAQMNLPLSIAAGSRVVLHTNLGALRVWDARNDRGESADIDAQWAGQSLVWLLHPSFNLMLEALWTRSEEVTADRRTERRTSAILSPGARFAIDRPSGLQIVPGIAFPVETRDGGTGSAVLLYLSLEHPFGVARHAGAPR